jgi:hypothetical protein
MCWSGEASAALATVGFLSTAWAVRKKEAAALGWCLGYFSLMEALQAYTYSVIDNCGAPANQVATLLGYLHICFQPFFINGVSLYFIDKQVAKRVAPFAYTACFAGAIFMLIKLYPFAWSGHCELGIRPMCGKEICAFHGNWHIAWSLPINDIGNYFPSYLIVGFIIPCLYGSWRFSVFHLLAGPVLARLTTSNLNEWPAVWCLLSIDLLLLITNTRLRQYMYVENWWGWKKTRAKKRQAAQPVADAPMPDGATEPA